MGLSLDHNLRQTDSLPCPLWSTYLLQLFHPPPPSPSPCPRQLQLRYFHDYTPFHRFTHQTRTHTRTAYHTLGASHTQQACLPGNTHSHTSPTPTHTNTPTTCHQLPLGLLTPANGWSFFLFAAWAHQLPQSRSLSLAVGPLALDGPVPGHTDAHLLCLARSSFYYVQWHPHPRVHAGRLLVSYLLPPGSFPPDHSPLLHPLSLRPSVPLSLCPAIHPPLEILHSLHPVDIVPLSSLQWICICAVGR
ncbi:hypothetical protein B0J13DRAFT_137627 [Dactylonectria estremocensis]|uniref:Uncharacterized protein n=1 Tax=Dactylonectria estremocensis TaxID=1079267 RepID=A0A9P9E1Z0_9HYPO|nr:hypothetical protein B0J13DRAFT_137627 [Dactylonectria estremocensis]